MTDPQEPADDFGLIISAPIVREAVEAFIKPWVPAYLHEVARQMGRDTVPPTIRSWVPATEIESFPSDQLPLGIVLVPGLAETPVKKSTGYNTSWVLNVAVVVNGQDRPGVLALAGLYAAAIRALLIQHPSMGGLAVGYTWLDERYEELSPDGERTMAACQVIGVLHVDRVVQVDRGPLVVPPDPALRPDDWPTATTADATVHHLDP